jgi:hypothetical protein
MDDDVYGIWSVQSAGCCITIARYLVTYELIITIDTQNQYAI